MSRAFRKRVQAAIGNPILQEALERNAKRRVDAWKQARASLPDIESTRQRARFIRQETIGDWNSCLDRFLERLAENGWRVHRAADEEQACRTVIEIAEKHGVTVIAKSKSMVSEEIGLNRALERAGIRPVETDLGEFIVQLRDEPPAHIITPAVHLRRQEVAETFVEKLGMPYTTDVEVMNATARETLREVFLEAGIGISGVNFGVAETGTVCLVTNEGNGRMVTTVPPVHIALMGAERLVPTLNDLEPMLRLLPQAATGQKITSYVSLIQRSRQDHDPDGPEERHLILVDNGRFQLAEGPISEALLCIRCGACLNACPVFREIGGHAYASPYPGPIGSVISPGLFGVGTFGHLAQASTLCGACLEVCPVQIDLPLLLLRTRRQYREQMRRPQTVAWAMRLYAWLSESPSRFRTAQRLAALGSRMLPRRQGWHTSFPPPLSAWTRSRHFPAPASRPFRDRWDGAPAQEPSPGPPTKVEPPSDSPPTVTIDEDLVARLALELEALGGELIRCTAEEAPQRVENVLRQEGTSRLLTWESDDPILEIVHRHLGDEGFEMVTPLLPHEDPERQAAIHDLAAVGAGLTGTRGAIAETGTIIVPSGPGMPALASLLPPLHLAILPSAMIYADMRSWLAEGGCKDVVESPHTVLVSGPSRTADIEMTLTIGVHGPGKLVVLCVE